MARSYTRQFSKPVANINMGIVGKFYTVVNCHGGIANVGIYNGSWEESRIQLLTEGCSYSRAKSWPTEAMAFTCFLSYFPLPWLKSTSDIKTLNEHAHPASSNLSNPSQMIQDWIGNIGNARNRHGEALADLSHDTPEVTAKREATRRRQLASGQPIHTAIFFTEDDLPPQAPAPAPIRDPAIPDEVHAHGGNATNEALGEMEDMKSTLSEMSASIKASPAKRRREGTTTAPTLSAVKFQTPIGTTIANVASKLANIGEALPTPTQITFESYYWDPLTKFCIMSFDSNDSASHIVAVLAAKFPACRPTLATMLPTPMDASALDLERLQDDPDALPHDCCVKNCPHNYKGNGGVAVFQSNDEATTHGLSFHHELLSGLDEFTLERIGWYKCAADGCPFLGFGPDSRRAHTETCETLRLASIAALQEEQQRRQTAQMQQQADTAGTVTQESADEQMASSPIAANSESISGRTSASATSSLATNQQEALRALCPINRLDELEALLRQSSDQIDLMRQVIHWASDDTEYATGPKRKDE